MTTQQQQLIDDLSSDFKPIVKEIEGSFETTQHHYGRYMSLLSQLAKDSMTAKVMGVALIQAGANPTGVKSALKVLGFM